jgi:DNA-binding CsgD family transcriptional regulator
MPAGRRSEEQFMSELRPALAFPEPVIAPPFDFPALKESVDADLAALLNRLNCGGMIVRHDGRVSAMNTCAEDLVGDGLLIQQQRVSAACHLCQGKLEDLLRNAFDPDFDDCLYICLPREAGKRPLLLQAIPLMREPVLKGIGPNLAFALLLLFDLDGGQRFACSPALRALGLTPAEVAVAALVGTGHTPQQASERLGITVLTVRTHLKAIFQKLGLQRQGDLVHIVSRLGVLS